MRDGTRRGDRATPMMLVSRRLPHFTFLSLRREILEAVPTKFRRVEGIVHAGVYSFVIFPRGADGVDNRGFGVSHHLACPHSWCVLSPHSKEIFSNVALHDAFATQTLASCSMPLPIAGRCYFSLGRATASDHLPRLPFEVLCMRLVRFFCFHQVLFLLISPVRHKSGQVPPPDHRSNRRSKRCLTPAHSSFKML